MSEEFHIEPYHRAIIHPEARVAPNASIVGDVVLDRDVTVLFSAVIRGDYESSIRIGEGSNVQECCSLHVDKGSALRIGRGVIVGHGALVHGCTVEDGALIGMGAIVMNDAVVGKDALIGAGALVPEGKIVPERAVMVGVPARQVRTLTDEEVEKNHEDARYYVAIGKQLARDGIVYTGADLPRDIPTIAVR